MATSISSPPSSNSAKCETNYTRLLRLVVDIGSKVFREVLDAQLPPPADLQKHLNSSRVHHILKALRTKKVLKTQQWDMLYPPSPGVPSSAGFDITLLFLLLRNTCGLFRPTGDWDAAPIEADKSLEADLIRVKRCRNEIICHKNAAELSDAEFETHWAEIESALMRLGGSQYEPEIQSLKIKSVDPENELYLNYLLQSWEDSEDKKLDALKEHIAQLRTDLQSLLKVKGSNVPNGPRMCAWKSPHITFAKFTLHDSLLAEKTKETPFRYHEDLDGLGANTKSFDLLLTRVREENQG